MCSSCKERMTACRSGMAYLRTNHRRQPKQRRENQSPRSGPCTRLTVGVHFVVVALVVAGGDVILLCFKCYIVCTRMNKLKL